MKELWRAPGRGFARMTDRCRVAVARYQRLNRSPLGGATSLYWCEGLGRPVGRSLALRLRDNRRAAAERTIAAVRDQLRIHRSELRRGRESARRNQRVDAKLGIRCRRKLVGPRTDHSRVGRGDFGIWYWRSRRSPRMRVSPKTPRSFASAKGCGRPLASCARFARTFSMRRPARSSRRSGAARAGWCRRHRGTRTARRRRSAARRARDPRAA